MDGSGAVADESQPELLCQLGVKIAHGHAGQFYTPTQVITAGEVAGAQHQRFIHGQQELTVAGDAALIAQGLGEGLAQADADILHTVVIVHMGVTVALDRQVDVAVPGEQFQHMIQKTASGGDGGLAGAIQI